MAQVVPRAVQLVAPHVAVELGSTQPVVLVGQTICVPRQTHAVPLHVVSAPTHVVPRAVQLVAPHVAVEVGSTHPVLQQIWHTLPQEPQLLVSVLRSTQTPEHPV